MIKIIKMIIIIGLIADDDDDDCRIIMLHSNKPMESVFLNAFW